MFTVLTRSVMTTAAITHLKIPLLALIRLTQILQVFLPVFIIYRSLLPLLYTTINKIEFDRQFDYTQICLY